MASPPTPTGHCSHPNGIYNLINESGVNIGQGPTVYSVIFYSLDHGFSLISKIRFQISLIEVNLPNHLPPLHRFTPPAGLNFLTTNGINFMEIGCLKKQTFEFQLGPITIRYINAEATKMRIHRTTSHHPNPTAASLYLLHLPCNERVSCRMQQQRLSH